MKTPFVLLLSLLLLAIFVVQDAVVVAHSTLLSRSSVVKENNLDTSVKNFKLRRIAGFEEEEALLKRSSYTHDQDEYLQLWKSLTKELVLEMNVLGKQFRLELEQHSRNIGFYGEVYSYQGKVQLWDAHVGVYEVLEDSFVNAYVVQVDPEFAMNGFMYFDGEYYDLIAKYNGNGRYFGMALQLFDHPLLARDDHQTSTSSHGQAVCGVDDSHNVLFIESIKKNIEKSEPRDTLTDPMAVSLGMFLDCNFMGSFGKQSDALNAADSAITFSKPKFMSRFGIELFTRTTSWVHETTCNTTPNEFNSACSGSYTVTDRLSDFSQWRGDKPSDEGVWVQLTSCYVPTPGGGTTTVGLAWGGAVCTTNAVPASGGKVASGTAVVSWQGKGTQLETNIIFAHEVGHVFGAYHDDVPPMGEPSCPGNYIMNAVLGKATSSIAFSTCSQDSVLEVLDTATCLLPLVSNAFTDIQPTDVLADVLNTVFVLTVASPSHIASDHLIGFFSSASCSGVPLVSQALSTLVGNQLTIAGGIPSGKNFLTKYHICYSEDNGTTYHPQSVSLSINAYGITTTTVTDSTKPVAVENIPSSTDLTINGLDCDAPVVSCSNLTLSLTPTTDCDDSVYDVAVSNTGNQYSAVINYNSAGDYFFCLMLGGAKKILQTNIPGIRVIGPYSNILTSITPNVIEKGKQPTLTFTPLIHTPQTRISFTLTNCNLINLVGMTTVNTASKQLGTSINDIGEYNVCLSVNGGSTYTQQTTPTFKVADVPGTPTASVSGTTHSSLEITFSAPDNFATITAFTFTITPPPDAPAHLPADLTVTGLSSPIVLDGLFGNFTYDISITATNQFGKSPAFLINGTTDDPVIPSAPTNGKFDDSVPHTLIITWDPPSDTGGAPILYYVVTVTNDDTGDSYNFTVTAPPLEVDDLEPYNNFTVVVTAYNSMGEGPSINFSASTGAPPPPPPCGPPKNLTVGLVTYGTVELSWEEPSLITGPIRNYTVEYRVVGEDKFTVYDAKLYKSVSVAPLKTYTEYEFYVRANNDYGTGEPAIIEAKTTLGVVGSLQTTVFVLVGLFALGLIAVISLAIFFKCFNHIKSKENGLQDIPPNYDDSQLQYA